MRVYRLGKVRWDVLAAPDVLEFLEGLDKSLTQARDSMLALLRRTAPVEPPNRWPLVDRLTSDILEFRRGRLRVLWFYDEGRVIVCTHGYLKKTRSAPRAQIGRAERKRTEYFSAKASGKLEIVDL